MTRFASSVFVALILAAAPQAFADGLSKRLLSTDTAVREKAVARFERLNTEAKESYVPDLLMAVNHEDPGVRETAQRLLESMGVASRASAPDLQKKLSTDRATLQEAAHQRTPEELQDMRQKDISAMRDELLAEKKKFSREDAENGLPQSPILQALDDPDPMIRSHAARQLSTIHPTPVQTIPTLISMLKAQDTDSRSAAAAALGAMGPMARDANAALVQALADPDPGVRQVVAEALRQIQPQ